jgi:hypothetical protein
LTFGAWLLYLSVLAPSMATWDGGGMLNVSVDEDIDLVDFPLSPNSGSTVISCFWIKDTYDQMLWEYRAAYPSIWPGALFLSDDATWNPAFPEFCKETGARRWQILRGVGVLQKDRRESAHLLSGFYRDLCVQVKN